MQDVKLPKVYSKELAEFVGIMLGDGHLNKWSFCIAGHSIKDKEYLTGYVNNMIIHLFDKKPSIIFRKRQQTMYLQLNSVKISNHLKSFGLIQGRKDYIRVPKWIYRKKIYMKCFLRGLVDTDGSLAIKKRYRKLPYYPVISIVTKNKEFIFEIGKWLRNHGFRLWVGKEVHIDRRPSRKSSIIYRVQLSGKENLIKWERTIGFANSRHRIKFDGVIGI